uniref:WAP four-disulfide core domain protein 2 n=1 Tax=Myotis lucifugus TaxID=59463 RepID=G1P5X0_MYOLU
MTTCRYGLLAALFLGLLLSFAAATGTGAGKAGVCPELKEELNCTQECGSDGECADNLKCCRAGCAAVCLLPNVKRPPPLQGWGERMRERGCSMETAGRLGIQRPSLFQRSTWPHLLSQPRDGVGQWEEEKPGSCPKVDLPLTPLGLCRDQCQVDSECPDQMKCCLNGCGKVSCVTPVF